MSHNIAEQMQGLYRQFGELPGIHIELHRELLAVRVENRQAQATVFLQGAQLSHYQRRNQQPTIWCSDLNEYSEGQALRGGIPVCWPWFGALSDNVDSIQQSVGHSQGPTHGFARSLPWQLQSIETGNGERTDLTLSLEITANTVPLWPYACQLQLQITIGDELSYSLKVENRDHRRFYFSNAFHSYFAVGDINQCAIIGLDQHTYIDTLDKWSQLRQYGKLSVNAEVDRIYRLHDDASTALDSSTSNKTTIDIVDHAWQRVTSVSSSGNNSAVVWNPWVEKSKRLSHFADNDYQHMLCVEIANTAAKSPAGETLAGSPVSLHPGELHIMSSTVSSRAL